MKTFVYRARNGTGATEQGSVKAVDRISALKQIRASGKVPFSVTEGTVHKTPQYRHSALVLLSVCATGLFGIVLILLFPHKGSMRPQQDGKRQKQVERVAVVQQQMPALTNAARTRAQAGATNIPLPVVKMPPSVIKVSHALATHSVRETESQKERHLFVTGVHRPGDTNEPNPYVTFRTRTENMLLMMVNARPGERMQGLFLYPNFKQDFEASLSNKIEIYPTDPPEVVANKEEVARLKEEIRKLVEQGQSAEEILTAIRDEHNKIADYRIELQQKANTLRRSGKVTEAEKFIQETNKTLEQYGVTIR